MEGQRVIRSIARQQHDQGGSKSMVKHINRRSLVKGAAGASLGVAGLGAASRTFAAPALIQDGPVEVSFLRAFPSGANGDASVAMIERFHEAFPDIKIVENVVDDYEAVAAQLITGLQTGDVPAIAMLSDVWWFRFYLSQSLEDITSLVDTPDDYVQSLYTEYQRNGGQWAVPFARSTPLFYYNADAVAASGVDPSVFNTWSDFKAAAPDLIAGSGFEAAFLFGNAASYGAWSLHGPVWAFGGHYSDPDFNILLEEEGTVNCGEFMRDFVESGNALAVAEPQTDFMNSVAVACIQSTGSLGSTRAGTEGKFEFKTAFLPEELQFGCCTGGTGLSIMAGLDDTVKQAAAEYLKFATNAEQTVIWSQATGYMPVRTSAVESAEMQAFLDENPNSRVAIEQLPKTQPQDSARVFIPNGDQMLGRGWEQILVQNRPAAEVWAEVTAELEPEAQAVLEQVAEIEG
jgi:sn-glycerol 3-phosphate transport system substrate-binding protein